MIVSEDDKKEARTGTLIPKQLMAYRLFVMLLIIKDKGFMTGCDILSYRGG